jgi:hypothetical protein
MDFITAVRDSALGIIQEIRDLIYDRLRGKESFTIFVSGRRPSAIKLNPKRQYEMALVNLETYYSFPSIDETKNKFRYSSDNGSTWVNVNKRSKGCLLNRCN